MKLAILGILLLLFLMVVRKPHENFATSHGTVLQLQAKGRHDQYLTGTRPRAEDLYPAQGLEQQEFPFEDLIAQSTKTPKLPHYYVGWYPGVADNRRRFQYAAVTARPQ
jgi:hypothetical protein